MKNLKKNPKMLSILKRRNAVMCFIIELAYDTRVREISFEINKKNYFIIMCNGIRKKFPVNTPIETIKSEIIAWILLTKNKSSKKFINNSRYRKKKEGAQYTNYTIFTELFPENVYEKRRVI